MKTINPCSECTIFFKGSCLAKARRNHTCSVFIGKQEEAPQLRIVFKKHRSYCRIRVYDNSLLGSLPDPPYPNSRSPKRWLGWILWDFAKSRGMKHSGILLITNPTASRIILKVMKDCKRRYVAASRVLALARLADCVPIGRVLNGNPKTEEEG